MTKLENDLKLAKENMIAKKNNRYLKDSYTGEIFQINGMQYISDRNDYINKENLTGIEAYRKRASSEIHASEKRIQEIDSFCVNGEFPGEGKKKDGTILGYIKNLGKFLKGNEEAYLSPVKYFTNTEENFMKMNLKEKCYRKEKIKNIYAKLNRLIHQIVSSDHFNFIPGSTEDAWNYYEKEIFYIQEDVYNKFIGEEDIIRRLNRIIKEEEIFIKSYSEPGVDERWKLINPNINYFDVVYDVMKNHPELYQHIKSGDSAIKFNFYPSEAEVINREKYFKNIKNEDIDNNLRYSETQIFQNEVVMTLKMVIEHDFPELFKEIIKG